MYVIVCVHNKISELSHILPWLLTCALLCLVWWPREHNLLVNLNYLIMMTAVIMMSCTCPSSIMCNVVTVFLAWIAFDVNKN